MQPQTTTNPGAANGPASSQDTIQQELASYTKWNEWLVTPANLVKTMDAVLAKEVSPGTALTAIQAACRLFYDAAQGMNKQVVAAIKGLQATPPVQPAVTFGPIDLPDWPDAGQPSLFGSAWSTVQPLLEMLDTKLVATHPNDPIVVALGGLIDAGDKLVSVLSTYYPAWAPADQS